jgi:hypothetical protein
LNNKAHKKTPGPFSFIRTIGFVCMPRQNIFYIGAYII